MEKSKLIFFKDKVVCPRCDGNGLLFKALIYPINVERIICDECDATWGLDETPALKTFKDLSTFLESLGSSYQDMVLNDVDFHWHSNPH